MVVFGTLKQLTCELQTSAAHVAFCTRGTYIRYLRARSWNVAKATKVPLPGGGP